MLSIRDYREYTDRPVSARCSIPLLDAGVISRSGDMYLQRTAVTGSLGGCAVGVSVGWNSRASETLGKNLEVTTTEIGLVAAVLNGGASIGALLVPFILRRVSRLSAMFLALPLFVLGWTFICLGDHQISLLIIGRIICGLCSGCFCVLTPLYVAEIADGRTRERLLTIFQLMINCGIMYAFAAGHLLNEPRTIWRYSLICGVACLPIGLVNLLPESPLYHLTKGNETEAESSLKWYRGDPRLVREEMSDLKSLTADQLKRSGKSRVKVLRNRRVIRAVSSCLAVILTQQLSGVNTIIFYGLTIFEMAGSGDLSGSEQTLLVGAVQILSTLLAGILIGMVGRRALLTVSATLMGLFLILLGWFFELRDGDPEYDDIYYWMPPAWLTLLLAAYNIGVGPISWSLLGDTFPLEIRVAGASTVASIGWLISLISSLSFGEIAIALGVPKMLWLFAGFCWLGAIFCAVVVRDTGQARGLAEIQRGFGIAPEESRERSVPSVDATTVV